MAPTDVEIIVLTREELYERIWTTAMRNLAPTLGVSDVGLKKICHRFKIPTPPLGYWAKLEHGKKVKQPRLPRYDDPELEGIKFYPNTRSLGDDQRPEPGPKVELPPEERITVPDNLDDAHPLVASTGRSLRLATPGVDGLVEPRAKRALDVQISPANVDRALRIMDGLLKALANRDLSVRLAPNGDSMETSVMVMDEYISFGIHEITDRQQREPTPAERREIEEWFLSPKTKFYRTVPTGRLCLMIHNRPRNGKRRRYSDSSRRPLESLLNAFATALYETAQELRAARLRHAERERERAAAEQRRQEFERERHRKLAEIRFEKDRLDRLSTEVLMWKQSQDLRDYIDAVREKLTQIHGVLPKEGEAAEWIEWASLQVDRLNPLAESPPSFLDEKSRWEHPARTYL